MYTSKQAERVRTERRVLGSMLIDPSCIPKILTKLNPDDFSVKQNREIFLSIRLLSRCSSQVDAVTVLHTLWEMGCWDELSYRTYLCQMMSETPTAMEVDQHITKMLSPYGIPPRGSDEGGGIDEVAGEIKPDSTDSKGPPPYPGAPKWL